MSSTFRKKRRDQTETVGYDIPGIYIRIISASLVGFFFNKQGYDVSATIGYTVDGLPESSHKTCVP